VSWATSHIRRPWSKNVLSTESYRSLRDGPRFYFGTRHFVPGYLRMVPSGQRPSTPVHEFDARSQSLRAPAIEDEDDAEDENEAPCELSPI
jgi:hypothetical protein